MLCLCLILGAGGGSVFAQAQEKHAVIKAIGITPKVYLGDAVTLNVTARNIDAGLLGADLLFRAYLDNQYWFSSYVRYVWPGSEFTWRFSRNLSVPGVHEVYVALYWLDDNVYRLQDISEKVYTKVVQLSANLSAEHISVERAYRIASTWLVKIMNKGNDYIYGAAVSIIDSKGLKVTPSPQEIGDLAPDSSRTLNFSVTAPSGVSIGQYWIDFTVSYKGFDGRSLHRFSLLGVSSNELIRSHIINLQVECFCRDIYCKSCLSGLLDTWFKLRVKQARS